MLKLALLLVLLVLPGNRRVLRAAVDGVLAVWRPTTGVLAVAALVAAAVLAVREDWVAAAALTLVAAGLAVAARRRPSRPSGTGAPPSGASMSPADARSVLGVPEGASRETVEAAYRRLMRRAHPDQGGTVGLAAQLNAARSVLAGGAR
jgi:hypothetical protein